MQGTLRAVLTNLAAGGVQEGGSTLTQQLVKQTLLQTADTPRSGWPRPSRRSAGSPRGALALALEDTYSKDELLTRYLNIVYYGQNAYGSSPLPGRSSGWTPPRSPDPGGAPRRARARARRTTTRSPTPRARRIRRNQVLARMAEQGYITPEDREAAAIAALGLAPAPAPRRGCVEASVGPYVCDFVQQYLIQDLGLTQDQLDRGGSPSRRRWTPSCSVPATPPSWTPSRWRTAGSRPSPPSSRARAPARAERQPDLRLRPPTTGRSPTTFHVAPSAGRAPPTRSSSQRLRPRLSTSYTQTTSDPYVSASSPRKAGPTRPGTPGGTGPRST